MARGVTVTPKKKKIKKVKLTVEQLEGLNKAFGPMNKKFRDSHHPLDPRREHLEKVQKDFESEIERRRRKRRLKESA
jgi:hypothetical protein